MAVCLVVSLARTLPLAAGAVGGHDLHTGNATHSTSMWRGTGASSKLCDGGNQGGRSRDAISIITS